MKKVISLLMIFCLMVAICVPSASAKNVQVIDLDSMSSFDIDTAESILIDDYDIDELPDPSSRIVVYEGARVVLNKIVIFPAKHQGGTKFLTTTSASLSTAFFNSSDPSGTFRISPTKTAAVLEKFAEATGVEADAWFIQPYYTVFTDNKGSYGEYFEFVPDGTVLDPPLVNGKIFYDLGRMSTQQNVMIYTAYKMPQDTSSTYYLGTSSGSGFFYYNSTARKHLSQGSNFNVAFNFK